MDPVTLLGILLAIISLLVMMVLEGSSPMSIILPAPMILVFFGTFGAALGGMAMADAKRLPKFFKMALLPAKVPPASDQIDVLVSLSERARKEGLLALEEQSKNIDDAFLARGLQGCVDGVNSDDLRDIMEAEIASKRADDKIAAKLFMDMGGYAPTIGIVGTVVGLIHVLENLSEPEKLGHLIAGAFVATLWGVLSANFIWLPLGNKVKRVSDMQIAQMELLVEGIVEIQSQSSPRALKQKLTALLPPDEAAAQEAA